MTELFSELRCSHACAYLPPAPAVVVAAAATLRPAALGADLLWDAPAGGYRIQSIVRACMTLHDPSLQRCKSCES